MRRRVIYGALILLVLQIQLVRSQTTEFTYQGNLTSGGSPVNGNYDFEFLLFDTLTVGNQVGSTVTVNNLTITNGVFTVILNFGNQFVSGADRFLEIRVRQSGAGGMTILTPRQRIGSSPYAVKSLGASNAESATTALTANNALQLGGVAANQFVLTTDPRMTDARPPTPGSAAYIQNTTSPQASSSFNISSTGTANILNALSHYSLGGFRVLATTGTNNLFAGVTAGNANSGVQNTFIGARAGLTNTTGASNTFVGMSAGSDTTTGSRNSFFGTFAGQTNTSSDNSFFGESAGKFNTTGTRNSFFGRGAGLFNTIGEKNSFFGESAGLVNSEGLENSFFGTDSGRSNTTGNQNAFFGTSAGYANATGTFNSYFGVGAGATSSIGSENAFFGYRAGHFTLFGDNSFFGAQSGFMNSSGASNSFFGYGAGDTNTSGAYNVFIGKKAGTGNASGNRNTLIGSDTSLSSPGFDFATAIGSGSRASSSNSVTIGRPDGEDLVRIPGNLVLVTLSTGGTTTLCRNAFLLVATCSSSIRYKSNITQFDAGLDLIRKLRPVSFNWKEGGVLDLGLVAEEVNKVEPLLTTTNEKGEVEGVKYDRVGVVLINAFKEQQVQIESLQKLTLRQQSLLEKKEEVISKQQAELDALKKYICSHDPGAELCEPMR